MFCRKIEFSMAGHTQKPIVSGVSGPSTAEVLTNRTIRTVPRSEVEFSSCFGCLSRLLQREEIWN